MKREFLAGRLAALLLLLGSIVVDVSVRAASDTDAPARTPIPAYRQADSIAVLSVEGEIDLVTLWSLERRVDRALREGADAIVFDIDTPGGRVDAALDICHLIKTDAPANTVAWINPEAYSAGTIIALNCREIVMAPHARMGDAAPIQFDPLRGLTPLPAAERAKVESPILEEVTSAARRRGYDERMVQSFVSVGIELWLVENITNGDRAFVDRAEYHALFGEEPPTDIPPITPKDDAALPPTVSPWFNTTIPLPGDGADVVGAPEARPRLTKADRGDWRLLSQVISDDRLLTISEAEALHYGMAVATIKDDAELRAYFGARTVTRYDRSWSEGMVRFLISWPVRLILIIVFVVGMFLELAAPGMGVFGVTAAVALMALIGAPYLAGMAQWWEVVLISLGLILIAAELFVVPGLGLPGLAGILCLLTGLVGTFVSGDISSTAGQNELATGLGATITALFAAVVAIVLIGRNLEQLPLFDRIVLRAELGRGSQAVTGLGSTTRAARHRAVEAGQTGTADTDLRPSGRALFDGRSADVVSVDGYIDAGQAVRIVRVDAFTIEVEEVKG